MTRRSKLVILILFLAFFIIVLPMLALFGLFRDGFEFEGGGKVVVVDVYGSLLEYSPYLSPNIFFGKREPTLTEIIACIDHAAGDDQVEALVLKISGSGAGAAKCEEMRSAVQHFRAAGKRVVAFSPVLVNYHYLLACAADSVFMPPSGYLMIPGPASSSMHVRGMLDKLGIRPNIDRIGDYKSAAELFTEERSTPPVREMRHRLLTDMYDRFVATIAEERSADEETVLGWIDRAVFSPRRASGAGLIDGVKYWDQIDGMFEDSGLGAVSMRDYMRSSGVMRAAPLVQGVAVIHAQGTIVAGESGYGFGEGPTAGSATLVRELRRARESERIKAVVLRVDSPGGDGLAGDMVSREIELTAREKPVVVSMSDVAASGGYEISYRADRIVALPGTITGSIGSITGKFNLRGFYDKIGLTKDEMGLGENSLIYSDYRDFSEEEWKIVREEHRAFYENWIEEIARFREMRVGEVDSLAGGRVWTGAQAKEHGLIDEIGGFDRALEIACELAGIDDPSRVEIVHLPRRLTLLQSILSGSLFEDSLARLLRGTLTKQLGDMRGIFLWRVLQGAQPGRTAP